MILSLWCPAYLIILNVLRWVYTTKVNLVKVWPTLNKMLFTLKKLFKVFNCSFKILVGYSHYTHISRIMDPIDEPCFAFVICILWLSEEGWGQGKGIYGQGTGCADIHKVVHMLFYCKNLIGMNIKLSTLILQNFPPNVHVYLFTFTCVNYSPTFLYWICLVLPEFCGSVIIQMKLEYLWGQSASVDQILYEASLGWGKACIRIRDKLDQNSGFHGNRNHLLTYNGGNNVSTFSGLFLIRYFLYFQVTRTCIKSRTVQISARSDRWLWS